jgi:hypothetical protein
MIYALPSSSWGSLSRILTFGGGVQRWQPPTPMSDPARCRGRTRCWCLEPGPEELAGHSGLGLCCLSPRLAKAVHGSNPLPAAPCGAKLAAGCCFGPSHRADGSWSHAGDVGGARHGGRQRPWPPHRLLLDTGEFVLGSAADCV